MKCSKNELSKLTGCTHATVTKRLESLTADKGPHGAAMYESTEALPLIYQIHGPEGESDRDKLLRCQAETAELELDRKRGELLSRQEVEDEVARCISNCKSRFMGIPTRAAPIVIGMSESEAQAELKDMVYEALNELAGMPEYVDESKLTK